MKSSSAPQSETYTLTLAAPPSPSVLKISCAGAKPENFTAYPSKLSGGIYGRVDFVDLDGRVANKANCINWGSAELQ